MTGYFMKRILLKNSNLVTLVDDLDYERLCYFDWSLSINGYAQNPPNHTTRNA